MSLVDEEGVHSAKSTIFSICIWSLAHLQKQLAGRLMSTHGDSSRKSLTMCHYKLLCQPQRGQHTVLHFRVSQRRVAMLPLRAARLFVLQQAELRTEARSGVPRQDDIIYEPVLRRRKRGGEGRLIAGHLFCLLLHQASTLPNIASFISNLMISHTVRQARHQCCTEHHEHL